MISNKAALIAVITAFLVGIVGSLALRPPGAAQTQLADTSETQSSLRVHWRMPTAAPSSIPVTGKAPGILRDMISTASNGAVRLDVIEPGEMVPAFAITDAVRDGKVEAGFTFLGYDQGKIPASALISAVPFGMEPVEFAAWWYSADGKALGQELYRSQNAHLILCGVTGPETAGWFRSPIESLDDVQGLKIRFAGIGGQVLEQAGASVTMLPAGEIFQALEKGAIDASEYALPIMDQSLGFDRIAKFNYYPGWHQIFTATHMVINLDEWNAISSADQMLIETACTATTMEVLSLSEALQGAVIANFPERGVQAMTLPEPILRELQTISKQVLDQNADADPMFAKILASQRRFLVEYAHWKQLAYLPRDF